ncbi:MAG TPA: hypothetical protein VM364_08065 [Vicinamibacterales bacterium]|nr:hypothetical protein [Vicinamibacterales bacterium]
MPVGTSELKLAHEKRAYQLRIDHNAIADLEDMSGLGLGEFFRRQMSFATRRLLLCVALRHERRGLQLAGAGLLIQQHVDAGGKLSEIDEALGRAVEESGVLRDVFGEDEKDDQEDDAAAAGSAGDVDPTPANG